MAKKTIQFVYTERKIGDEIIKKRFTKTAWDIMGPDKNHWKIVPQEAGSQTKIDVIVPQSQKVAQTVAAPQVEAKSETREELMAKLEALDKANKVEEIDKVEKGLGEKLPAMTAEQRDAIVTEYKGPFSSDEGITVPSAIKYMKGLLSEKDILDYLGGDGRVTVVKAATKFISELK